MSEVEQAKLTLQGVKDFLADVTQIMSQDFDLPGYVSDHEPDGSDNSLSIEGRYGLQMGDESWLHLSQIRQPIEKFALNIWKVAEWLESQGNGGFSKYQIKAAGLPTDFMVGTQPKMLKDILFINEQENVYCRKKPYWKDRWIDHYRHLHPWYSQVHAKIAEHEAEQARLKAEDEKPKRSYDHFALGALESYTTVTIAYMAACLDVMMSRYHRQVLNLWEVKAGLLGINKLMLAASQHEWHILIAELRYRRAAEPPPQSSKKKDKKVKEDWAKAGELLEKGTSYFFSRAFVEQAIAGAEEPDLRVDRDNLPKQPLEQTPINRLSDRELVESFFKFVDGDYQPGTWEYEDKQLILKDLRIKFAAVKGQRV